MTNEEYIANMDLLKEAFRTANMMIQTMSQEYVDHMSQTLDHAESMGFLLVAPIGFAQAMKNVDQQRKLLQWANQTRALYEEFLQEASSS